MASNAPPPVYVQSGKTSTLALVSLIAGIAGLTVLPVIGSIVAVITGHMAKGEIRNGGGMVSGDGLATAGLILGYIGLGLTILGICAVIGWFIFTLGLFGIFAVQGSTSLAPALALVI
jgi:hypothetical protein